MQYFSLFSQGITHRHSLERTVFFLPDMWVPKVIPAALFRQVIKNKNRIALILGIVFSVSKSNALRLHLQVPLANRHLIAYPGVHEHMRAILHRQGTAGETSIPVIRHVRRQCDRQVPPMQKVRAHGVSPVH